MRRIRAILTDAAQPIQGSGGGQPAPKALELEGDEDLADPACERDDSDVDHEQDRLLAEVPGDPEGEQDLDQADDQLQPPELELLLRDERDRDVEDALDEEEEADERGERRERVVRVPERPDPHENEQHAEDRVHPLPAGGRDRDREELVDAGDDRDDAEEDRDRVHRREVPLEDEQREDEPRDAGDEEQPPAVGGLLEDLARPEHVVHRSSLDVSGRRRDSPRRAGLLP